MTTTTYAIINSSGECINRVIWDGKTPWSPPENCTAVPDPDNLYPIKIEEVPDQEPDPLANLTEEQKQALIALLQSS